MARLNLSDAVRMLFAGMTAAVETDEGVRIPMQATGMKGAKVWATAPRLAVAAGMTVRGRIIVPEEVQPWLVRFTVEDASFHTNELARVRLRAMAVGPDQSRRRAQRVPAGGVAWLIAVSCRDVVDGDKVEGTIVDLSESGVAFATRRVLRLQDRLIFHGRFFAEHVEAEVRVTSLRDGVDNRTIVGCAFLDINPAQLARVRRLIAAADSPPERAPGIEIGTLREAVGEVDNPGWRGLFRRS
jgi:PilZ domain